MRQHGVVTPSAYYMGTMSRRVENLFVELIMCDASERFTHVKMMAALVMYKHAEKASSSSNRHHKSFTGASLNCWIGKEYWGFLL